MRKRILIFLLLTAVAALQAQDGDFRLAVLPFQNIGGDRNYDWLSRGIAESLTLHLSDIPAIVLINRSYLEQVLKEQEFALSDVADEDFAPQIGRIISANRILTGSYQLTGEEILINAHIVKVETGEIEKDKSCSVRGKLNNIFGLYDELAGLILKKFNAQVPDKEKGQGTVTDSLEAYRFYMLGRREMLSFTREGYEKAREYFLEATIEDPVFAAAYAGLAEATVFLAYEKLAVLIHCNIYGEDENAKERRIRECENLFIEGLGYAKTASSLDSKLPDSYRAAALANYYLGDSREAQINGQNLLALNKKDAFGYYVFALIQEDWERGYKYIEKALRLDPDLGIAYFYLGNYYAAKDDFKKAAEAYVLGVKKAPLNADLRTSLGELYFCLGNYEKAALHLQKAMQYREDNAYCLLMAAVVLYQTGERKRALELFDRAIGLNWQFYSFPNVLKENYGWDKNMISAWAELRDASSKK